MFRFTGAAGRVLGALLVVLAALLLRARRRSPQPLAPLPPPVRTIAVIPVLDEAGTIGGVLDELRAAGLADVIVVDGGSVDGTADLARGLGATVIDEPQRGYGRACRSGAMAAPADVIVFLDGDGSDDPSFVPLLVDHVVAGAALALGVRTRRDPGAMLAHQLLGNRMVTLLVWLLHGLHVEDVPPMRAVRADVLGQLELRELTYGWPTEMIVKTARAGLPIAQVSVRARRRGGGESKIAGRLGPSLAAGLRMIGVVLRHA